MLPNIEDNRLRVYVIWMPVLQSDDRTSAEWRTREFANEEFIHFWDEDLLAGLLWQRVLGRREVPWDIYMLYNADADWKTEPAIPDFWRHRLNSVNKTGLKLKLEKMLRKIE